MIEDHYERVKKAIGRDTELCVVTKKRSVSEIRSYYDSGERIFGENHARELLEKVPQMPQDVRWQFIGHLQRNKVRGILPYVDCIQSLDSLRLAHVIENEAEKISKVQNVLVEFHLADEDTNKTGLPPEAAAGFMQEVLTLPHVHIIGMMVMGPHTDDTDRIRSVFNEAHDLFLDLQKRYGKEHMHVLSMGMSADYPIAVECGSTMVRIGTYLFA